MNMKDLFIIIDVRILLFIEKIFILFFKGIRSLLEELGCSTSSNGHHDQSQSSISSSFLLLIIYFVF
jgi:hypothetical protein